MCIYIYIIYIYILYYIYIYNHSLQRGYPLTIYKQPNSPHYWLPTHFANFVNLPHQTSRDLRLSLIVSKYITSICIKPCYEEWWL